MFLKFLPVLALVALAIGVPWDAGVGDVDSDLTAELYGKPVVEVARADAAVPNCTTDNNKVGLCVPYYLCNLETYTTNTDRAGINDVGVRDYPCDSYLDTCCLLADIKRSVDILFRPKPIPEQKQGQF